ncbi:MAG: restriction endonuclease [Bacteroidales bacterium]|nr:restriction endonuclease [Bacteroidales bacterium]
MNRNTEFERFVQRVFQKLACNDLLKPSRVEHNVKLKGKSGCEHQIDVYWEYEKDGNTHRVAIECKNYKTHVPIGKMRDFFGVLKDLNNVRGILVSSKGYQEGAKKFADFYGIALKELRRPGWNESIGSITTTVHADIRNTLFLIDEGWIAEHNFSLDRLRKFYAEFQDEKADYWRAATHFPIETKDHYIRNAKGEKISSLDALEQQLPENPEPGTEIVFPFEDGWLESSHWGPVRIREVKFEYESRVQETTLNLAADDFVEAILEDALGDKTDYVPKF